SLEHPKFEGPPSHGRGPQDFVLRGGVPVEPRPNRVAYPLCQRQPRERLRPRGEATLVVHQTQQLAHEERIAAGPLGERDTRLGMGLPRDRRDELRHGLRVKAAKLETLHVWPAGERAEELREWPGAPHLDVAVGAD